LAGAGGNAEDALAPPKTWSRNPDPLKAQLIELDKASSEFAKIQAIFQKSLGGDNLKKLKQVVDCWWWWWCRQVVTTTCDR
jgi:hypothetical protein